MQTIIDAFLKYGRTTIATVIGGAVLASIKKMTKKLEANSKGTMELLGDKIDYFYEKFVENGDGTIKQRDFDKAVSIGNAYKALNGNHGREKELEEIDKLRIKN